MTNTNKPNNMKKNFIDESGRYTLYDEGVSTIQREYAPVYDEVPAPIDEVPSYQPLPFFGEAVDNPYNPKLYVPQEPEMPVYEQPVYGQPISYPVYEQPVYGQPVYEQPKYEQPVMQDPDMPIYNPKFYNPIDEIMNPPALPIYDLPPAPIEPEPIYNEPIPKLSLYIPKFPDFTQMSCADLQSEINDMNQTMMTSRMVQEVRMAYETALSDAQNVYIQKCGKKEDVTPAPINVNPPATPSGGSSAPVFNDDTKTPVKTVQSGDKADGTFQDDTKAKLPIKGVSKNLQPYIYAGLGIVVILVVARMLSKKN